MPTRGTTARREADLHKRRNFNPRAYERHDSLGISAGSVWIEYADPSPEDDIKRADYVSRVAAITPGDPTAIMSQQQMQDYLGIDHEQWAKDEEYKTGGDTE